MKALARLSRVSPGCWSQGRDEDEALRNIEDAIREYLAAVEEQLPV